MSAEKIKQVIESRIESTEPQNTILQFFRDNAGKRITKLHIQKLREITGEEISLNKSYGMTHLEWGGYSISRGRSGGRLLLSHSTTNVVIDPDVMVNQNIAYFSALEERNTKRHENLSSSKIEALAKAIEAYKLAKKELGSQIEDFVDDYAIFEEFDLKWGS